MADDVFYMKQAIRLSQLAAEHGNEPFGAVLVDKNGEIAYTSENRIYTAHDFTYHAEMGLVRDFCAATQIADLGDYTLYSSCEPCFMCSGALVWARLGRLVYGASDRDLASILGKEGADTSATVFALSHRRPTVTAGVLREESIEVLKSYFSKHPKG